MVAQTFILSLTILASIKVNGFVPKLSVSPGFFPRHVSATFSHETYSTKLYADGSESAEQGGGEEELSLPSEETSDILSSPVFLKRKIDVLKSDIADVGAKLDATNIIYEDNKAEWGPQIDALQKEYANIQDRMTKQSAEGNGVATLEVARKMLDTLDNFDRAFGVVTPESEREEMIESAYKKSYQMILETFGDLGIKEVETVGKEFDYEFHQAVMMRPDEDHEEGLVCEELAKGYIMEDGTLIRAAMVVVAA